MSWIRSNLKILLPIAVLAVGFLGAFVLIATRPKAERRVRENPGPLVRVVEARPVEKRFTILSQGTVEPRTEITLVAEVAGRALSVSPSLASGSFFEKGEVLLGIDPRDYELAVVRARGEVAQAHVRIEREEAEAEVARNEWRDLGEGDGSPLALREPQLAEVRAALATAEASLAKAKLDLERTKIRAPFAGLVREKLTGLGQFVTRGTPVARIYAVDYVEVRLPLPDEELAHIDLPLNHNGRNDERDGPEVRLTARVAGEDQLWLGEIVRMEGEIDRKSRMVHLVARVEDPYGVRERAGRFPLVVGLFVDAEIAGRVVEDVFVLPREALRDGERLFVVDEEEKLRFLPVHVVRASRDEVVIGSGLDEGVLVCLSPLDVAVDGMKVRIESGEPPRPATAEGS